MIRVYFTIFIILIVNITYSSTIKYGFKNEVYAYNGENASYWEETRTTITYFENKFEPYALFIFGDVSFKLGVGLLIPFDQESKLYNYYPIVQTKIFFSDFELNLGSLDAEHNFPAPILDPLISYIPQLRVLSKSQVPIDYETFPKGIFSHGCYEYGFQLKWDSFVGIGELYMNWQLPDTTNHRERFDVGFIHQTPSIPFYLGIHYWHNGGHENFHPIDITENYTAGIGLKGNTYSTLILSSYFLPDRDSKPELNALGFAIYLNKTMTFFDFNFTLDLFCSSEWLDKNLKYISIEGDPFYRVPFYTGINLSKKWELYKGIEIEINFINGYFLPNTLTPADIKMIRYDQSIKTTINYEF